MKAKDIIIFILNNNLIVKKDEQIERHKLDVKIIKYGRINDIKELFKLFNKSSILKASNKKIFSDNLYYIYFSDYTDLELSALKTAFNEYGFDKVNLICFANLLKYPRSTMYLVNDISKYCIYTVSNFEVINSELFKNIDDLVQLLLRKYQFKELILIDNNHLDYFKEVEQKYKIKCYVLDNDENYIFKLFTERNS